MGRPDRTESVEIMTMKARSYRELVALVGVQEAERLIAVAKRYPIWACNKLSVVLASEKYVR